MGHKPVQQLPKSKSLMMDEVLQNKDLFAGLRQKKTWKMWNLFSMMAQMTLVILTMDFSFMTNLRTLNEQ